MPSLLRRRLGWREATLLALGYLALDWVSRIHTAHDLKITPWSPAPALALLFLMRFRVDAVVPLVLAIVVSEVWVHNLPLPSLLIGGLGLQRALTYWAMAELLRRCLRGRGVIADRRGLVEWVAVIAVGSLLNDLFFAGVAVASGHLPAAQVAGTLAHYWLGDVVGIVVSMPLLAMLLSQRGRSTLKGLIAGPESFTLLATGVALVVALASVDTMDLRYLPILFLPIAWAAARQGIAGAALITGLVQCGIILATHLLGFSALTLLELQLLMVVLALSGCLIGVVVDEKQRLSSDLQQSLRLAAAGEMAGALSHELHQPLTALLAYARASQQLLERGESGERLRTVIERMVSESVRAADVVSRLRDFFRTGSTRLERIELRDLLTAVADSAATQARQESVELTVQPVPLCDLWADRLQLEVVLRNLIANAVEATADAPSGRRQVCLSAQRESANRVCITVEDSGPGVSEEMASRLFEAFQSSKASGLGLGLTISRAIVEAHGGSLWAEIGDRGLFKIVLPSEEKSANDD